MTNDKRKKEKEASENRPRGKRLGVILVLAAIAVAALVLSLTLKRIKGTASSDNRPSTFTVRRDDLRITVTEGGSIRARKTIEVKCEVDAGREGVRITSIVPEGTYITQEDVNNGKVLVRLDSAALEEELTQREIDFASAEARYTQAKEANDIQVNQNESSIADAELKVRFALMDLQKYLGKGATGSLTEGLNEGAYATYHIASLLEDSNSLEGSASGAEIKRLKDNIVLSEQQLEKARDQLAGTIKLHDANYVSHLELKTDQLSVTSSTFKKERDELTMDLFELYDFPKQVEQLLSDYEESKRKLERTYAECRSKLAQKQADLKSAESRYQSRKERLNKTIRNIERCIIKAPAPGLVTYGSGSSGDRYRRMRGSGIIAEGETVYQRQTIISLPDTADMMAEIDVHESSVDKVRPGQRAKIVMDAFPDKTFQGEVLKVAPMPNQERGWFSPNLKVYTTQVVIEGSHDFLKPGMSAKVEILVERLDDVIIAPVQTVANLEGKKVSYCLTPDGVEQRVVQTGSFNDTFVQIIDGLQVGEKVLLSPPRLTEAKAKGKPEPRVESKSKSETKKQQPPGDKRTPEDRHFELTDEAIERVMGYLAKINPKKSEELKQLRKSDPEKFKEELRKVMREQSRRFGQNRSDENRRTGNAATGSQNP
jgi:multidrug resistance efflux pump